MPERNDLEATENRSVLSGGKAAASQAAPGLPCPTPSRQGHHLTGRPSAAGTGKALPRPSGAQPITGTWTPGEGR